MPKLINELYPIEEGIEVEESEMECEHEISFQPLSDKATGEIVAVLMTTTCLECGEERTEMFTNGDIKNELLARDMGFRNEDDDEEDYC